MYNPLWAEAGTSLNTGGNVTISNILGGSIWKYTSKILNLEICLASDTATSRLRINPKEIIGQRTKAMYENFYLHIVCKYNK